DRGRYLAVAIERGVEAAVAVIAGKTEVEAGRRREVARSGGDDFAVPLDGDAERAGPVGSVADRGRHLAAGTEGGVEAAVAVVAGDAEVEGLVEVPATSGRDDLAVSLDGDAARSVSAGVDRGRYLAARTERGVKAAVAVVP